MTATSFDLKELEPLTPRQRAFVLAYVQHRNGKEAARTAGYTGDDNAMSVRASELVRKRKVVAAIKALTAPALQEAQVTTERVLNKLAYFAFAPKEFDENGKIKIPIKDQIAALKALGDHLGLWKTAEKSNEQHTHLHFPKEDITAEEARQELLGFLRQHRRK